MMQTVSNVKEKPGNDSKGMPYAFGNRRVRRYSYSSSFWKDDKSKHVHLSREQVREILMPSPVLVA